jgi:hypothetical protein
MKSRNTFRHILVAVAPRNIQTLENEARTASKLAAAYPENETAFHSLESDALQQIFRIITDAAKGEDVRRMVDKRLDREASGVSLFAGSGDGPPPFLTIKNTVRLSHSCRQINGRAKIVCHKKP